MATATLPLPAMSKARNGTHVPASPDAPTAILTTVTPQMARDWLAAAHPNRPLSRARVKTIARAITASLWQVNGGTLVLCPEFRLLDGRHRCLAIVDAGRSVQTFVVCGIDPACFGTMDQGGKRSGADVLAIAGNPQAQTLASALRWCWRYEHQQMLSATIPLLDYELPGYLAQHPDPHHECLVGRSCSKPCSPLGPPRCSTCGCTPRILGSPRRSFMALASGLELTASDPVYLVRERYIALGRALYHTAVVERAAAIVRAWNGSPRRPAAAAGQVGRHERDVSGDRVTHAGSRGRPLAALHPPRASLRVRRRLRHGPSGPWVHATATGAGTRQPTAWDLSVPMPRLDTS